MVDVTIDNLLDIGNNQLPDALVALQQNGLTFKARERPNPPNQINVTSQAQLEAVLGSNLIIPAFSRTVIKYDDDFTQTKPFLLGEDAVVEISGTDVFARIVYDFDGPVFDLLDPTKPAKSFLLNNLTINGNDKATIFNLKLSTFFFTSLVEAQNFVAQGQVECFINKIEFMGKLNCGTGIVFKNPTELRVFSSPYFPPSITDITALSVIYDGTTLPLGTSSIIITDVNSFLFTSAESMIFLDPNPPAGTSYIVEQSNPSGANLYQPGVDIVISSVADNGSGNVQFTTATPHGLVVGRPVVISDFINETTYNKTFIVTAVNTPLTGNTFDVDEVFVNDDSGNMNAKSLDSTDILVSSVANPGKPDSMFTGDVGLELFSSQLTVTINDQDVPEPIVSASWLDNNLERFSVSLADEGQLSADDLATRRYTISYSATISKFGGATVNIGIVLLKNGVNVSFNAPRRSVAGAGQIVGESIIELAQGDTIQIAVINYDLTSDIIVLQASMVISLA